MNKHFFYVVPFCIFVIIIFLGEIGYATTYYVKTNGNNSGFGTNWISAWKSIAFAASNVTQGDVVIVSNGIYKEKVSFLNNGTPSQYIEFHAFQKNQVVIDAELTRSTCFELNNISYVLIDGFVCKRASGLDASGISLTANFLGSTVSNIIKNTIVYSNEDYGIYLYDATSSDRVRHNTFLSNTIYKQRYGIVFSSGKENIIKNNLISESKGGSPSAGIYLVQNAILNVLDNNTLFSNFTGIYVLGDGCDYNSIVQNKIFDNNWGIDVSDGDYNYFTNNNIISNNINYGIILSGGTATRNLFRGNTICSNDNGIFIWSKYATNNIFQNNQIFNNASGIYLPTAYDTYITKTNNIYHNTFGIRLVTYSGVNTNKRTLIQNNIIYSNDYGIELSSIAESNIIKGNILYGNNSSTVSIYNSSYNIVDGNNIHHNWDSGNQISVYISGKSINNSVINNYITNNYYRGVGVSGSTNFTKINHNIISKNNLGILISSDFNSIFSNQINQNATGGLKIYGSSSISNVILSNTITGNGEFGVELGESWEKGTAFTIVQKNKITKNKNGININYEQNNIITYNNISQNSNFGVYLTMCTNISNSIIYNNIVSNSVGVSLSNASTCKLYKNNFIGNPVNLNNASGSVQWATNNWWGSTRISNIRAGFQSGNINFIPYRLSYPFDLSIGADTDSPTPITTIMAMVSNYTVSLKWSKVLAGDLSGYSIYESLDGSYSNLDSNRVIGFSFTTNFLITSTVGPHFYYVTAKDSSSPYTNEAWYSSQTSVTIVYPINTVQNISNDFQVTFKQTNVPVLGLKYVDLSGHPLKRFWLANIGTMIPGQHFIANLSVYSDAGVLGSYDSGIDKFLGYLNWNGTIWTNDSSVTIGTGNNLLVTLTTRTTNFLLFWKGDYFQAYIVTNYIQCSANVSLGYTITGPTVTFDTQTPLFTSPISIQKLDKDSVRLSWSPAVDNFTPQSQISYTVYEEAGKGTGLSGAAILGVSSTNLITSIDIIGLSEGKHYFIVQVFDFFYNNMINPNEVEVEIKLAEDNLNSLVIGPSPYIPNDGNPATGTSTGIIFDKLTSDALIRIYSISGEKITELKETDGDGKLIWAVPDNIISGVYFCVVSNSRNEKKVQKIVIIK